LDLIFDQAVYLPVLEEEKRDKSREFYLDELEK
jgi:hypothetical protein